MQTVIDAKLLAQVATDQLEDNEVVTILHDICTEMPSEEPENRDYDRLYVANRLCKANKTLLDKYRLIVLDLMKSTKGHTSCTRNIDGHLFKLYYLPAYTWQNLHLKEKPEEEMTELEKRIWVELENFKRLHKEVHDMETDLSIRKQQKKTCGEILASLLPNSDCIKYTPVLQVS